MGTLSVSECTLPNITHLGALTMYQLLEEYRLSPRDGLSLKQMGTVEQMAKLIN